MSAFSIKFDTAGLTAGLEKLGDGVKREIRPAAQAGAQVLYEEALARVPVLSGLLRSALYQVFSKDNSSAQNATYHISWNARTAPHGHLVEFGTSRAPAHPFLRPAYDAKVGDALRTANDRWVAGTKKTIEDLKR